MERLNKYLLAGIVVLLVVATALAGMVGIQRSGSGPAVGNSHAEDEQPVKKKGRLVETEQQESVEFKVASAKRFADKIILNSARNYKASDNKTVVLLLANLPEYEKILPKSLIGKTVKASGTLAFYNDTPEVIVDAPGKVTFE